MEGRTRARWTRRDPKDRRAAILDSARRVFADRPYEAVNMADVASAAGISRALVNHYFGSKRELYIETLHAVTDAAPNVVRTDLDLPVEEMVARNTDAWLDPLRHPLRAYDPDLKGEPWLGDAHR